MKKTILGLALIASVAACKPGEYPSFTSVEQTVLADIKLVGITIEKIEADIQPFVPAGSNLDAIVDDALQVLMDLGLIPSTSLPQAQSMHATLAMRR
jgi:hypothetical protein